MMPAEPWQWAFTIGVYAALYVVIGLGEGWLMRAIQTTIILAVIGAELLWKWTPNDNGYVTGIAAIGAAWLLTVPPVKLLDWYRYGSRKRTQNLPVAMRSDEAFTMPQAVPGHSNPEAVKAELRNMLEMDKR